MDELRERIMNWLRRELGENVRWFEAKGMAMTIAGEFVCTKYPEASFREIYQIASEAVEDYFSEVKEKKKK